MRKEFKNAIYTGANAKKSLFDLVIPSNWNNKLIIFIHGYMGYKDWGAWNLVSEYFTNASFAFLKYNVSHNGGTIENPIDFDDLDSFAENNYLKEVEDFESILKIVQEKFNHIPDIYLIGHSRGGGIALLQSNQKLIKKMATWAAISNIEKRFPSGESLEKWKNEGIYYRENGRTHQQMPHHFSQFENFSSNKGRLNIETFCKKSTTPTLVIHGDKDSSVSIDEGKEIANWLGTTVVEIKDAQHTFGSCQPWTSSVLPKQLEEVCKKTRLFFEQ